MPRSEPFVVHEEECELEGGDDPALRLRYVFAADSFQEVRCEFPEG